MKKFLYLAPENDAPVIVNAKHRPSEKNIPTRGTWVLREWYEGKWTMPCFPEITWGRLKYLKFVGKDIGTRNYKISRTNRPQGESRAG